MITAQANGKTFNMAQDIDSQHMMEKWKSLKIVVAGDLMLDHYVHGKVTRISPEGPFPVLSVTHETDNAGGAGNVYSNLKSLGVNAVVVGVVGDDEAGRKLKGLCPDSQLILAKDRPTIQKNRMMGNGTQIMRVDYEVISLLLSADEQSFIASIKAQMEGAAAIILSDYGKGALSKNTLENVIALANQKKIPVLVDPKGSDYSIYKGADVVTPNRKELAQATGYKTDSDSDIEAATHRLLENSGIVACVATRSEDGMTVMSGAGQEAVHLKTEAQEISDVSGAGDTVIATLAAGLGSGLSLVESAKLANKAAGIAVGRKGAYAVEASELFEGGSGKAWTACEKAKCIVDGWKSQGLKVGFTNGCFDILHAGHVTYLAEAAQYCDRLVLGLNHDYSVRILKGPTRPVNDEDSRATVMASLTSVDCVVLFGAEKAGEDNTPCKIIGYLQPDIIFKGGDYTEDQLPEAKIARSYGGDVKIMGVVEGKSTTNIINKINAA